MDKNQKMLTGKPSNVGGCEKKTYEFLKDNLFKGRYLPGERLVEREISEALGVSRTPIRWALRQLESEGYLERLPTRGYRVKILGVDAALQLMDVREALEGMAARLAAHHANDDEKKILKGITDTMEEDILHNNALHYYYLCTEFHQQIGNMSKNSLLTSLLQQVTAQSARFHYQTLLVSGRISHSCNEHKIISECIIAGDEEKAESLIREHVRSVKKLVEQYTMHQGKLFLL